MKTQDTGMLLLCLFSYPVPQKQKQEMKLWIPREKVENRLKLQIIPSLIDFFTHSPSPKQPSYTENPSSRAWRSTDHCTATYMKEELFITWLFPEVRVPFPQHIKATAVRIVSFFSWRSGAEWFNWPITDSFAGKLPHLEFYKMTMFQEEWGTVRSIYEFYKRLQSGENRWV